MELHRTSIDHYKKIYGRRYFSKLDREAKLAGLKDGSIETEDEEEKLTRIAALTELLAGNKERPSDLRTFSIISENHSDIKKEDRITIRGYSPLEALRNHYKAINKDILVEVADGNSNTWIQEERGGRFHYHVREKNLFEKLAEIHCIKR